MKGEKKMVACQDCGTEFFNEFEPLSTICANCVDDRDSYYADWLAERADDTHHRDGDDRITDPLIQYEDGWR